MSSQPTVVLLHGVGLDHSVWEGVAPLLAGPVDVVVPDLPGHGAGPRVPLDVDLAGLADLVVRDLPAGLLAAGADPVHLVGFSLGALVAQHLAIHRPELVASLTSVSSVCRRTPQEAEAVAARLATAERDVDASYAASVERWFAGSDVDAAAVGRTRSVLAANDPDQFLACYRVFATGDAAVADDLGRIDVPALAVTGAADPGSTPEMTHRLAASIPGCRAVVVPEVRHMLPLEAPGVLAEHVLELIGGTTRDRVRD
ncbi:alpha/beta hydrolase [Nocardioides zeae]|uniref:Alpha/beta hydrolase n=1 Tax=Nocardioides imazamoxiresistens TaxID=3231893 RepID=A0ABU3PYA4_9ACTN|nr:alpha/beta hydrolase [Nocardioides zeae]MDT9594215.1 alpha/beta hydrolase [Nocardioides zeae]